MLKDQERRHLTVKQVLRALRPTEGGLDALHNVAEGKGGRGAMAVVSANALTLGYTIPKPAQAHELSGSVTIRVESPFMGAPGAGEAKVALSAEIAPQVLSLQQGPIMAIMSTEESAETPSFVPTQVDIVQNAMTLPSIIEDGKLAGEPDRRTPEQRRADARADWLADEKIHADNTCVDGDVA